MATPGFGFLTGEGRGEQYLAAYVQIVGEHDELEE